KKITLLWGMKASGLGVKTIDLLNCAQRSKGMTKRCSRVLVGLMLNVAFASVLWGQRSDRVVITGLVTDSSGAAIPKATVTVTNEATNIATSVSATDDGNYSTPPLILGPYTV